MKRIIRFLASNYFILVGLKFLNTLLFIKNKKQIIFSTENLNYSNGWVFKRWFEKKHADSNIKMIFLTHKKEFENSNNIENHTYHSFRGVCKYIQSKYIISTTGPLVFKSFLQIEFSVWHGMPIKAIPIINKRRDSKKQITKQITVSRIISLIFAFYWDLKKEQFIELGEPIFDYLNAPDHYLFSNEKDIINSFISKDKENILYAPTYRNSKYGKGEGEGVDSLLAKLIPIIENTPDKNFIISLHPQEFISQNIFDRIKKNYNCSILEGLSTDKILPFIDTLIFDYSSLYFQGLYLNKKLIGFIPDFKEYSKTRGVVFENNEIFNEEIMCTNEEQVIKLLKEPQKDNTYYKKLIFPNKLENCCDKIYINLLK